MASEWARAEAQRIVMGLFIPDIIHNPEKIYESPKTTEQLAQEIASALDAVVEKKHKGIEILEHQGEAWWAVVDALHEVSPDWLAGPDSGMNCAVKAIKEIAAKAEQKDQRIAKLEAVMKAGEVVSTRWLEGRLSSHEMGILGRSIVEALQALGEEEG